jgi:hypothetical protein
MTHRGISALFPSPSDTLVYTEYGSRKRAALLFDRQYIASDPEDEIPAELRFTVPDLDEAILALTEKLATCYASLRRNDFKQWLDTLTELGDSNFVTATFDLVGARVNGSIDQIKSANDKMAAQAFSARWRLFSNFGLSVVSLFPFVDDSDRALRQGTSIAFNAAINNIPAVAEDDLTWDQILSFRQDAEAVRKFRALRTWLVNSVNAASISEAQEIIAKKVDDYEWAIKKHALRTVTGGLTNVLSSETFVSVATGTGIATLLHKPAFAIISSGLVIAAKIGAWVEERRIDLKDIEHGPNSEVALICEARRLASKHL